MSQENMEVARRAAAAWNRGDMQAAIEVLAADVDWDVSRDIWRDVVGGGHYRGVEGVMTWLRDLYDAWETMDLRYEELIDAGEHVVDALNAAGLADDAPAESLGA